MFDSSKPELALSSFLRNTWVCVWVLYSVHIECGISG